MGLDRIRRHKLWDWLELLALPVAVGLTPVFAELRSAWSARHSRIALCGLVVFAAIVLGGYLVPWAWTGFTGNTLWDWLHLLLLPLLIPTIVVPALMPAARAGVVEVEVEEAGATEGEATSGEHQADRDEATPPQSPADAPRLEHRQAEPAPGDGSGRKPS